MPTWLGDVAAVCFDCLALFGMTSGGNVSTYADGVANAPYTNSSIIPLQK